MGEKKRVLIVGGVAGGASAATRLRRLSEDAEIVMFERGEHVSFANCGLPYHIGEVIPQRESLLVTTPEMLRKRYRIDVRPRHEVLSIDRQAKEIVVRNLQAGAEIRERYDALILSPGAAPIRPSVPGADHPQVMTLRNIADMDAIKRVVDEERPANAVVIGGGYIGLEMAEALRERNVGVTLVELAPQVFAAADTEMVQAVHDQLRLHGVDLRLKNSVERIEPSEGNALAATLQDGSAVDAGLVIMAIGVRPEVTLAKEAGLAIGETGGIAVSDRLQTSDPNIYAIGDAIEVKHFVTGGPALIPLAGPANRQGRIAADNILGGDSVYQSSQGTAICKVFDIAIGMTGMSERLLKKQGIAYEKVYVHPQSHAGYYPGARPLSLKLLFAPNDGRILGAQATGQDGVDKRIDVLATAMRAGMSAHDLVDLELTYAPPYGSAKDPVNYAGFVASNSLKGIVGLAQPDEAWALAEHPRPDTLLLDVRTEAEVAAGGIPGAMHIPVDELRDRLSEIPKDKMIIAYCKVGLRGYLATRQLMQRGFAARNLTGGYTTYKAYAAARTNPTEAASPTTNDSPMNGKENANMPAAAATSSGSKASVEPADVVKEIDATALQCPGPIMRLAEELKDLKDGKAVSVLAADPGFGPDVTGWCRSTGNRLADLATEHGMIRATVVKGIGRETAASGDHASNSHPQAAGSSAADSAALAQIASMKKHKSMVVFSGDFDKVMASLIIANGAAAMGSKVTMFFTFWGLSALRKPQNVKVSKNLIEKMFGWMMPRGADKLTLSKMNMGGMGLAMIKGIMKRKNVTPLPELIQAAQKAGVTLVACTMSMDLMGIKKEELLDGVEYAGVGAYLDSAESGNVNLFI